MAGLYSNTRELSGRKPTFLLALVVCPSGVLAPIADPVGNYMMVDVDEIRRMAERVTASENLTLIDVELKGGRTNQLLRIYIDKPQGVSHADCQVVSEQMSALLDVQDMFPGAYTLEVSSPGLDRKLLRASDYEHFAGRKARLVLREPLEDGNKVLEGRLLGLNAGRVRVDLGGNSVRELDLASIAKARLVVEEARDK